MSIENLIAAITIAYLVGSFLKGVSNTNVDVPSSNSGGPSILTQAGNILASLVGGMTYSSQGLQLTENSESLSLTAYWDASAGVWTIGWGHTGPDVYQGLTIDYATAVALLQADIQGAVATVNRLVSVSLTQGQFDALVDFVYNVGSGNFESSTLLEDVNNGNFSDVGTQLARWNHAGGNILAGLTTRRANEAAEFYS